VTPNGCVRAVAEPLNTDRIYLLVERANGTKLVTGTTTFCTADVQFEVSGRENCQRRGLVTAGFAATTVQGRRGFAARVGEEGLEAPRAR
jgi:uncharacterized membrane protein